MTSSDPTRLREHPEQRFAAPVAAFALAEAAGRLRAERGGGQHGHRQQVLYRHGPTTVAIFDFDQGARLADHAAGGTVIIQVLEGEIDVRAEGQTHRLPAGHLLAMAPGVRHDVQALRPSAMLLTVSLERPGQQQNC